MMVVAGTQMHVPNQSAFPAPHDKRHFRVRLESDQAINDVCACFLQTIGQRNVCGLIKSSHELDNNRYLFA